MNSPDFSELSKKDSLRFITVRVAVYTDNSTVITIIIMDSKWARYERVLHAGHGTKQLLLAVRTPLRIPRWCLSVIRNLRRWRNARMCWRISKCAPGDPPRQGADMSYRRFSNTENKELERQKERNGTGYISAYTTSSSFDCIQQILI